ncbi:MAG: methyltransferase domain-containing protein [Ktedonobacteraceae bacterium]|nr:methyltransferase domain-containing protein [Ktedonobacteraceae bacterium]
MIEDLEAVPIDYTLLNSSALFVQGVDVPQPQILDIALQWDLFERAHALFQAESPIEHHGHWARFSSVRGPLTLSFFCYYNTVIVTDPDRLLVPYRGLHIWVKALDYFTRTLSADDPLFSTIKAHLRALQAYSSQLNELAWNQDAYDAWVQRFGTPQEAGARIKKDPRLASLSSYLEPLAGKTVINLLGSHGAKAVAMALLGAEVTVVDISRENAHYANSVAHAAGAEIRYLVSDVLNLPENELNASYDLVLMELGILHYFVDLEPLASVIAQLLRPGGRLVLQDFHPISTKLISSKGKKHKITGNYFDKSLIVTDVAFSKHLPTDQQDISRQVYLRRWTLGEVVTAIAQAGLVIRRLDEEPNSKIDDIGLPKTFTLVAEKPA